MQIARGRGGKTRDDFVAHWMRETSE
jgi:hypothetical protein